MNFEDAAAGLVAAASVNWAVVGSVIGTLVSGLVTFLLTARRMSGKIKTSDADSLWVEARSIREDYKDRLSDAGDRQRDLEMRVAKLEGVNTQLVQENYELRRKVDELEALVALQAETIKGLEERLAVKDEQLREEKQK